MSGLLALLFAGCFFLDAFVIMSSYICSRIIFNGYLKKHYRQKWEELVSEDYVGLNWFAFDKTNMMSKFRTESVDDLGDPKIQQIRKTSIYLFKIGIWGWFGLVILFIAAAVIAKLIEK